MRVEETGCHFSAFFVQGQPERELEWKGNRVQSKKRDSTKNEKG